MEQRKEARLSNVCNVRVSTVDKHAKEGEQPIRLCNYVDVYKNEVIYNDFDFMQATCTPDEIMRFRISPGDVLFTKDSETAEDIGIPAFIESSAADLICGYHVAIASPYQDLVDPKFLFWFLSSRPARAWWETRASGVTRVGLRQEDIRHLPLGVLPPVPHQQAIADFLDRETAQIDAMIEAQAQLVRSLTTRRALTITDAVSSGLDETGLHDTGLLWLGQAPSHWELVPLKKLGRATIGLTYTPDDVVDGPDEGTLVLRAGNIQRGRLDYDDCVFVSASVPREKRLRDQDLLICSRNGSARLIGKSALISGRAIGETWGAFMTVFRSPITDYLYWVLNSAIFERQLGLFSTSTINQLTTGMLHNMRIAVPPRHEQLRIISHIEATVSKIDHVLREAERTVALLRERREALITAGVTGRIDPATGVKRIDPTTYKEAS